MKIRALACLIILPLAAYGESQRPARPVMRDAATHDQIVRALRHSEQHDPMKDLIQASGEDPSKSNQPVNLLEQSDIISFGGLATLVPKRAILATPTNHKERLTLQPGSRIVGWAEFYALNRGWITTVEVSRVQAEGNLDLAEETRERIGKSSNLVVATCLGGPISVLPLKVPETDVKTAIAKP
ncbi:MAG: hypothetical protein Q8Q59_10330 [Luteolibacter sp.]|nr:hypothetical protein [Luteolibacter sp.]